MAVQTKESGTPQVIRSILTRDYAFSFLAFFTFLSAFHSLGPTLPLYLAKVGSDETEIGVLVGIIGVASLVSRFLAGRVISRYSEKVVMMGGAMMFAITFIALIVFRPFWPYFVIRLLQGAAFASLDTAAIAYAIRIVPERHRSRGMGYFLVATSLASAVAATSSVFILNSHGFTAVLFACIALSLAAFLLSWMLKRRGAAGVVSVPKNIRFFEPRIVAPAILSFLFFFSWAGVAAFFPLYAVECGVSNPGLFFSASSAMIVLVRAFAGKAFDLYPRERTIPTFLLLSALGYVILSFSTTLFMFILVGLLMGAALAFLIPVCMAYALEYAGKSGGSAVATYQASMDLALALGPAVLGVILPRTGYRVMFLCVALVSLVSFTYFQFFLKPRVAARR